MAKTEFYEHPCFTANKDKWETYRDLYEGDHETLVSFKYLWPHELELSSQPIRSDPSVHAQIQETVGQRIRRIRARRSRYLNMTEPVVSNLIAMAFKKQIAIDPEVETLFGDEIADVDGKGTSLESFIMGPLAIAYFRDGRPILHVDAPENSASSRAEERTNGFRPFLEILDLREIPDWQLAEVGPRAGKFDWLRYQYEVVGERGGPTDEPKEIEYCKVLALENGLVVVRIYRQEEESDDWTLIEERPLSGWAEIPVSTIVNNESWIKDVSELQLVLFNLMSAYYNQLNTQAFQRVFIAGDLGEKHQISISEYAVSQLPAEAKPYVIEPSSMDALVNGINSTAEQIYKVAFNRTRSLPAGSKEAPGADTIQEMNLELIVLLKQALEEMETLINQGIRHYAMFKLGPEKGANFTGKVTLPKDIDVQPVAQRLEIFLAYKDEIRKVLPWRKAELSKAAGEMGYDRESTQEILKEIEKLESEPVLNPLTGMAPFMGGKKPIGNNGGQDGNPAQPASNPPGE